MEQVVSKIALEPCKISICVPVWEQKLWWKSLHDLCISYICLPTERGIYLEGWKRIGRPLQPPTWQSAIFLLDSRVRTCTVTPNNKAWVSAKSQGKGWSELIQEMPDVAQVLVTLRSGKEVVGSQTDEEEESMEEQDSGGNDVPLTPADVTAPTNSEPPVEIQQPLTPHVPQSHERDRFEFFRNMNPEEQRVRHKGRRGRAQPSSRNPQGPAQAGPVVDSPSQEPEHSGPMGHPLVLEEEWVMCLDWGVEYQHSPSFSQCGKIFRDWWRHGLLECRYARRKYIRMEGFVFLKVWF